MRDSERLVGAIRTIVACIDGTVGDRRKWGLAWLEAMERIDARAVARSCREVRFEGTAKEKREAHFVARMVSRGTVFAKRVQELEHDAANLYPADLARRRLDEELGWRDEPTDSIVVKMDRLCMRARAGAPEDHVVRAMEYTRLSKEFEELGAVAAWED